MKLINELKRLNKGFNDAKHHMVVSRRELNKMRNSIVDHHCPVKIGELIPFDDGRRGTVTAISLNRVQDDKLYFLTTCVMPDDSVENMTIIKIDS